MGYLDDARIPYTLVLTKPMRRRCRCKSNGSISFVCNIIMEINNKNKNNKQQQQHQYEDHADDKEVGSGSTMSPLVYVTSANTGTGMTEQAQHSK